MATRNFVPRADGEGGIGTSAKQWAGGFFKKLAVVAITTAVTVLTPSADANNQQPATTSWVRTQFKSILEGVLSASGVKYNIAQNGYVCLGAFFGGLILQWGRSSGNTKTWVATLPISSSQSYLALAGDAGAGAFPIGADVNSNTIHFYQQIDTNAGLYYFVISKV